MIDDSGDKVGKVTQVFLDDRTGRPSWVSVRTGFFGTNETLVPLSEARYADGEVHVPFSKAYVKDAPNIDAAHHLDEAEETELYRYYGMEAQYAQDPRAGVAA